MASPGHGKPALLDLGKPETWPHPLRAYLDDHHDLFLGWESKNGYVSAKAFDDAIYGLMDALLPYAITGWHCSRLTDAEIDHILSQGMQLPDAAMLDRRIDALVAAGHLTEDVARRLKAKNQSGDSNRAGMLWFCFFPPRGAGEHGIERFFRHWGGEALYNSHEDDPVTSSAISGIGTPCLIEADVPIASLEKHGGLSFKVYRRFLASRGYDTREPVEHGDRIKSPLAVEAIRRVIRFPGPEFQSFTGCADWRTPIGMKSGR
jgi:hypothetical protein